MIGPFPRRPLPDGPQAGPSEVHLDLKGLKCPLPALRTRKALATLAPGTLLVVTCTDPMAVIDIPHIAQQTGDAFEGRTVEAGVLEFRLRKAK
ncbi:sulfurtransferase TusA family protein [Roseixanthobacter glucoisosaccharinicivorans]|uniref:sulfurtransferase TusA family protein n=1 Tax=Roseixanthobacter glucoisosaccharinicivorans TaxID=3119923 RepID=UPI00372AF374